MVKFYFKQVWNLLRQETLFSTIYILGTALSVCIVMVLSIVFYIRIGNIYPETNRDRLLIAKQAVLRYGKERSRVYQSSISYQTIETCFKSIKSAEAVTAIYRSDFEDNYIQPHNSKEQWPVTVKYIDENFWQVFPYRFKDGTPFTTADMESGMKTAVIAESLAKKMFGSEKATGQYVSLDFINYRICGVVKDASFVTEDSYAQIWIPYTVIHNYKRTNDDFQTLGNFYAYILAPSSGQIQDVKKEALENIQKYASSITEAKFSFMGQPDRQWQSILRVNNGREADFSKPLLIYGFILLILLLIPAISLSGMIDSRMERRSEEMGVRRAFGAPCLTLTNQVLIENLLFTLIGGLVGLCLAYIVVLIGGTGILNIGKGFVDLPPEGTYLFFTPAMLLNLPLFFIVLGICFSLNFLAGFFPAWRASHHEIIYSLTGKQE